MRALHWQKRIAPCLVANLYIFALLQDTKILGHLLQVARQLAVDEGLDKTGYRVVINDGPDACQTV